MSGWNITRKTFCVFQELSSIVHDLKRVEQQLLGMDLIYFCILHKSFYGFLHYYENFIFIR